MEEEFSTTCEAPDLSGLLIDLDALGHAAIATLDPPIVIPPDWRSTVAHWPHENWSRWRRYAGEFLASLDEHANVETIRRAERAAFDFIIWEASS